MREACVKHARVLSRSCRQVLDEALHFFRGDFATAQQRAGVLAQQLARFLPPAGERGGRFDRNEAFEPGEPSYGGGSFLMNETCPGEPSYVGLARVAGAKPLGCGGIEPRARTEHAPLNPRGC